MEHKDKGFVEIYLCINNSFYLLSFYNLFYLRNYVFPENYELLKKYPLEIGDIIISEITKTNVKNTIQLLFRDNYFNRIKPIESVKDVDELIKYLKRQKFGDSQSLDKIEIIKI